jgi:uncharacterized protein (TIGR04222 family)
MKKLLFSLIVSVGFFLIPQLAYAAEWDITNFKSDLVIQEDGKVAVTETIAVDFHDTEKHGIYRDIPYVYQDENGVKTYTEIDVDSVQRDNKKEPYETSHNNQNFRIKIGDGDVTINGEHTYVIRYIVTGVLQGFAGYDELYWNVTGNDWEAPIHAASARVTLPEAGIVQFSCYQGERGSTDPCPATKQNEQTIDFTIPTGAIENMEIAGMTVAVGYTKGMVPLLTAKAPRLIENEIFTAPTAIGLLSALIIGVFSILRVWWLKGRDEIDTKTVIAEYETPENLRPAEIGTLVDERADTLDVTATIIDLASRGFLTIKELKKKWLFGQTDYELNRTDKKETDLLRYEKTLLGALFASGKTISLSSLKNTFYDDLAKVKQQLYEEITARKLFVENPEKARNTYVLTGVGILVVGFGLLALGIGLAVGIIFGLAIGTIIVGIMAIIVAFSMPKRTEYGREMYRKALGYKLFINTADRYRARFDENQNLFTEMLPYAIVFGVTKKFAKAMADMGIKPSSPGWYYGVHPFNPVVFASDVDTFSQSLSTAIASSPSSSGSGGGGSSGGGFGGGGGGSW